MMCIISADAPVAQLDRAIASGAIGREFESLRARQFTFLPSSLNTLRCILDNENPLAQSGGGFATEAQHRLATEDVAM